MFATTFINSLDAQTRLNLWNIKMILFQEKQTISQIFQIVGKDRLNWNNFYKVMQTIQPQISYDACCHCFKYLQNQDGFVYCKIFQDVLEDIDLVKDSPKYIQQQNELKNRQPTQEDNLASSITKLEQLKKRHTNGEIDLAAILKLQKVFFKKDDFFFTLEHFGAKFTPEEQYQLFILLDKRKYGQIKCLDFLDMMGIQPKIKQQNLRNSQFSNQDPKLQEQKNKINNQSTLDIQQSQIQNTKQKIPSALVQEVYQKQQLGARTYDFDKYFDIQENINGVSEFINQFKLLQQSKHQTKFIDQTFPPNKLSLLEKQSSQQNYYLWDEIQWFRPEEFLAGQIYMFIKMQQEFTSRIGLGQYISPRDIIQGSLGDCYFLSALSSLAADKAHHLMELFLTRRVNEFGIYCVKMCHDGEWKAIYVDDYFPCYSQFQGPCFTRANGNELWVLILEKAYAKLYGSYQRIESGICREALRDLTGAPTKTIYTIDDKTQQPNKDLEWILRDALNPNINFIVTCGTEDEYSENISKSTLDRHGLAPSHAYSIIGVFTIKHPQLGEVILLKLRNPWGKNEWKGDWSIQSSKWTDDLKKSLKVRASDVEDGIFFISLQDFQRFFNDIAICSFHDNYLYTSIRIQANIRKSAYIKMIVKYPGRYYLTIIQRSKRNYPRNSGYDYIPSRISLLKVQGNEVIFYGSVLKRDRETYFTDKLPAGTYIVQTKLFQSERPTNFIQNDYIVSAYGTGEVDFKQINKQVLQKDFFESAYYNYVIQKLDKFKTKNFADLGEPLITQIQDLNIEEGYGFILYQNKSNKLFQSTINYDELKGLKFKKPYRGQTIEVICETQKDFFAIFTVYYKGYSMHRTETYSVH